MSSASYMRFYTTKIKDMRPSNLFKASAWLDKVGRGFRAYDATYIKTDRVDPLFHVFFGVMFINLNVQYVANNEHHRRAKYH